MHVIPPDAKSIAMQNCPALYRIFSEGIDVWLHVTKTKNDVHSGLARDAIVFPPSTVSFTASCQRVFTD